MTIQLDQITSELVQEFAAISGDYNPLHLDDEYARRTVSGKKISHGCLVVLLGLAAFFEHHPIASIVSLQCTFKHGVTIGEDLELIISEISHANYKFIIRQFELDKLVCTFVLKPGLPNNLDFNWIDLSYQINEQPWNGSFEAMANRSETIQHTFPYPSLIQNLRLGCLEPALIFALCSASRTIGMRCPGKHSILTKIALKLNDDIQYKKSLFYVSNLDRRFNFVEIKCITPFYENTIEAHQLPQILEMPNFQDIEKYAKQFKLSPQRALVVGGSRGLGEIVTKILAMAGASVTFTYYKGESDSLQLVNNLSNSGYSVKSVMLDVTSDSSIKKFTDTVLLNFTHCYYFATPKIFDTNQNPESKEKFDEFLKFYVWSVKKIFEILINKGTKMFFYPSSISVDPDSKDSATFDKMLTYSMAKSAGETLCSYLQMRYNIYISKPRLPRFVTDQTRGLRETDEGFDMELFVKQMTFFWNQKC